MQTSPARGAPTTRPPAASAASAAPPAPRRSAAERQAHLLAIGARQREQLAACWHALEPSLSRADGALVRLGSARDRAAHWLQHPIAKPLGTAALVALLASGRSGRLLGAAGAVARLAGGATRLAGSVAALASLWQASGGRLGSRSVRRSSR